MLYSLVVFVVSDANWRLDVILVDGMFIGIMCAEFIAVVLGIRLMLSMLSKLKREQQLRNERTEIVSWFVTYAAFIDHDQLNQGVPVLERIASGKQFVVGSQYIKSVDDKGESVFVPSLTRDLIYRALGNSDIGSIELLSVVPMRAQDILLTTKYDTERAQELKAQQESMQ